MKNTVYLAFINKQQPFLWQNIEKDLVNVLDCSFSNILINIDLDPFHSPERQQYYSTLILANIIGLLPEDALKIVGITDIDLYIPILTFIFGEAQLNGSGALVSTHRLRNEYYGLPQDKNLLYQRTFKEVLHELGHTFGLVHCGNYECVMSSSPSVDGIDIKKGDFCRKCRMQLSC